MKKFTLILLIGLILPDYVCGQETTTKDKYEAKRIEKKGTLNSIFFAPLNLFDIVNPNFQVGYERFVAKKWALQIEGGIVINHSIPNYIIDLANGTKVSECPYTSEGFRVKGSIKYILFNKRKYQFYVSPELFYMRNKSGISRSFVVSDPDFEYSFDIPEFEGDTGYSQFFYNDERKMGINFKAGIKLFLGKRFFIEPHLGIGLACRNVNQTGRENPNDEMIYDWGVFDSAAPNKWVPTLPFNIKVGFRF